MAQSPQYWRHWFDFRTHVYLVNEVPRQAKRSIEKMGKVRRYRTAGGNPCGSGGVLQLAVVDPQAQLRHGIHSEAVRTLLDNVKQSASTSILECNRNFK